MGLGSNLIKQLLDSYSSQTKNVQQMSENQMKNITSAVIAKLEKLTQSTKSIEKEMEKPTNAVFDLEYRC